MNPESRRKRKRIPQRRRMSAEDRRQVILGAAGEEFAQTNYASATMAGIAERAQTSQALVFHYFGSKAELYAAVVRETIGVLARAQRRAIADLGQVGARERVKVSLLVYLDHIAGPPDAWAVPLRGGDEPPEALDVRERARKAYVRELSELLGIGEWKRHGYAVRGYFGFLDAACLAWVEAGCPADDRHLLIDAALGALEGALGDWGG